MKQEKSSQYKPKNIMVPITVNGVPGLLNTSMIPRGAWASCHGKTKTGAEVNSLKIAFSGDSAIIEREDGFRTSFNADEFEVLAFRRA